MLKTIVRRQLAYKLGEQWHEPPGFAVSSARATKVGAVTFSRTFLAAV